MISGFAEKMESQQKELQERFFKKQEEFFEKQKAFELEIQDREDERQNRYLESLSDIFQPQRNRLQQRPLQRSRARAEYLRPTISDDTEEDPEFEDVEYINEYSYPLMYKWWLRKLQVF